MIMFICMHILLAVVVLAGVVTTCPTFWWVPPQHTTWQWQIENTLDTSYDVDMYDVDLFDTPASVIQDLHTAGRKVICYFSAGSFEDWRSDAGQFPSSVIGEPLAEWDEGWLDIRTEAVRDIMKGRLDLAVQKECDGVEPDNVDVYTLSATQQGFQIHIDANDQLDYNQFLAYEAHARHLSVGLKNDVDQIGVLQPYFDWALNESCMDYNECSEYGPFINNAKAVFHVQYTTQSNGSSEQTRVCPDSGRPSDFMTLIKTRALTSWRLACLI